MSQPRSVFCLQFLHAPLRMHTDIFRIFRQRINTLRVRGRNKSEIFGGCEAVNSNHVETFQAMLLGLDAKVDLHILLSGS